VPTSKHRSEYELRVNRVLDYIRAHRDEELTLETLAQVAAFSPFHFHRIFKEMTGENLKELIQRTRLEAAASQLLHRPQADILEIAMDNGFTSASAFARAFKDRFGMTASAWRTSGASGACERKDGQADRNPGTPDRKAGKAGGQGSELDRSWSGNDADSNQESTMNVTVKNLPPYHVAYLRNVGPYGPDGGIPQLWQKLARWASARDLWTPERICIGMALDDPMVTAPAKCRYDAAIVVPAGFKADGGVNLADIPGGKHAIAEFSGSSQRIGAAWSELFGKWLPESGYQPDNVCFELYRGEAWDGKTDQFRCELCVPVRPL
jgi:AraC family transcriptional regulator